MGSKLTPLMRQYRDIKNRYPDGILFFQVGDFYETFYDDAEAVSKILNIALTTRDKDKANPVPLAGVPLHAADAYIGKLLTAGKKVIVCDQVESPAEAKGIVKRRVTDVITPGTSISPATLEERENNYVVSLVSRGGLMGFTLLDLSTGEMSTGEAEAAEAWSMLTGYRFREAIIPEDSPELAARIVSRSPDCAIEELAPFHFGEETARDALREHFRVTDLSCFGVEEKSLSISASGAMLRYVKELRQIELRHITGLKLVVPDEALFLDAETLRNLEIFESLRDNSPETTLIHYLDRTRTAGGSRKLRKWLLRPARTLASVEERLDGVGACVADQRTLGRLREQLKRVPDIERLLSRITARKAGPRELRALLEALERAPEVANTAAHLDAAMLRSCVKRLKVSARSRKLIEEALEPTSPVHLRNGGVIRKGFDSDLDRLIDESEQGRMWIASLQTAERERTGIPSLKVGFNKVFGYYIEVSRAHDRKIPGDYVCKQTLVASQRYVTEELKNKEQAILSADARRIELEREIFFELCDEISRESEVLQDIAGAIALLDVIAALAHLAAERGFCRPEVSDSTELLITNGRHPVVEAISEKDFIPNDIMLRPDETQFLIITGPNMGGKSTYIRQTAIIAILAHMGSFVPASRAVVGLMDRIFTRVGSSDNLARGQSTFLVEMSETAKILHHCTSKSLVLLDEVGRGTSTLDGLSLAWAVTEYLVDNERVRPKTLFATHYHELTLLAETYGRIKNMRVDVKEWGDDILFLYKIKPGASDKSYGIHVAQLAGLPEWVIGRAGQILASLERGEAVVLAEKPPAQISLFTETDALREKLKSIDINSITPVEALQILSEIRRMAD